MIHHQHIIRGLKFLQWAFFKVGLRSQEMAKVDVRAAGIFFQKALKKNVRLRDHSLAKLAKLGYPYSRRNYTAIHDPEWLVHKQTGSLHSAIRRKRVKKLKDGVYGVLVYVDVERAPYAVDIVFGTSKMVPRNFVAETMEQTADEMDKKFVVSMTADLKKWTGGIKGVRI